MPEVGFPELVELYRKMQFDGDGGAVLHVSDPSVASILEAIDSDERLYEECQISVIGTAKFQVGDSVRVNVAPPKLSKGLLFKDFDALFKSRGAAFEEPDAYYVIDAGYSRGDDQTPTAIARYRALLRVIHLLREAASYASDVKRELVFIGGEVVELPLQFQASNLTDEFEVEAVQLLALFDDPLHGDEKLELLAAALIAMIRSSRRTERFGFVLTNLDRLREEVEKGYRLFVSSFSYEKIRKEIEVARFDYLTKIHKTIVDIQGQLLSIPVATIVVATQLKVAGVCDVSWWTNSAILAGAWIFVVLLALALGNQWKTLDAIGSDLGTQRLSLEREYAAVRPDFIGLFEKLSGRITWQRCVLVIVGIVGLAGAGLATAAYASLTSQGFMTCMSLW